MSRTTQLVDQAIQKLEIEDSKDTKDTNIDESKKDETAQDKQTDTKDASASKPAAKADDKPTEDTGDAKTDSDKDEEADAEGKYTADDALEEEIKPTDEPKAPTDNAGVQLSPDEQKYIVEHIGEPIVIRGIRGTGDNAKEVEIKAYSPGDIPADFKFANDAQLVAAQTGFTKLEQRASDLLGNYRQNQSNAQAQDYERRENEGIKADLAELQQEGKFPKFRVKPGDRGFDDTPEAKQMAEVLQVMAERNDVYMKQYQQGRPFKHIGFAEAYDLWEAKNPDRQAAKKADEAQAKEDAEREKKAEQGSSNRGMSTSNIVKPTIRSGTTTRDILARIDAEF